MKKPKKCCDMGTYECQIPMPINGRIHGIDYCIADIVAALNAANLTTIASCCGHGIQPAIISLTDGRELTFNMERNYLCTRCKFMIENHLGKFPKCSMGKKTDMMCLQDSCSMFSSDIVINSRIKFPCDTCKEKFVLNGIDDGHSIKDGCSGGMSMITARTKKACAGYRM